MVPTVAEGEEEMRMLVEGHGTEVWYLEDGCRWREDGCRAAYRLCQQLP